MKKKECSFHLDIIPFVSRSRLTLTLYEYRKLRSDDIPLIKAQKFKSAHTELRRLDRKKESLLDKFIDELNPVNQASAFASKNIDKLETYSLYRRIVSLVIKQRTEAALEFQRSVEQSLEQLSSISSLFEAKIVAPSRPKRTM
ncbi:DUF4756 family protein [Salmonella enterica]|nr:DUF4756 family protein [Salmonella enterica]